MYALCYMVSKMSPNPHFFRSSKTINILSRIDLSSNYSYSHQCNLCKLVTCQKLFTYLSIGSSTCIDRYVSISIYISYVVIFISTKITYVRCHTALTIFNHRIRTHSTLKKLFKKLFRFFFGARRPDRIRISTQRKQK